MHFFTKGFDSEVFVEPGPFWSPATATLKSFMLSMSDQQLVSGVALLIAGFAKHMEITTYSMDVIAALAYLSSSVHLATLPLIRDHLKGHAAALYVRFFFMFANLAMCSSVRGSPKM